VNSAFFDTNVLLYLLTDDDAKASRAEELLDIGGTISVQVLNEFAYVARRKYKAPWRAVHESLVTVRTIVSVEPMTLESHDLGLRLAERYRLSVFDGQLLACATLAGCDVFYSEDMQDGQTIDGLTIRNPFAELSPMAQA
jgi:predicted nucleic acid-binding protein